MSWPLTMLENGKNVEATLTGITERGAPPNIVALADACKLHTSVLPPNPGPPPFSGSEHDHKAAVMAAWNGGMDWGVVRNALDHGGIV